MADEPMSQFQKLLEEGNYLHIPQVGDVVTGKVISNGRKEIRIDIDGYTTGVVRGRELFTESSEYNGLEPGVEVEATIIDLENENGELELSFRFAGQQKAWEGLRDFFTNGEPVETKILEANKGGLIVQLENITGFLPVSQLSPEHYPRVSGGDKQKILEKLKSYVGIKMRVRVIDVNEEDEKLIVSEKAVWEDEQKNVLSQYKIGDKVEGEVTALADFGAFVKFDSLEGLVHISEIAWQRIDHPRDLLKIGQTVKAEIIGLEGSKIFLSMKKLIRDPWANVETKYKIGDKVMGTILKVNPFGFFVELDDEIHGLAHVSALSDKANPDVNEIGKAGEKKEFRIVSIEPKEHRLGLSLKDPSADKPAEPTTAEAAPAQEAAPEEPAPSGEVVESAEPSSAGVEPTNGGEPVEPTA